MSSLLNHEFMHWLTEFLAQYQQLATHLIFEASENSLPKDISSLKESITRLRSLGSQVSLDHFGTGSPSFGYLRNLKLGYIKIDGSYIHNIESSMDNQFFLTSLAEIAHGLDIEVIAETAFRQAAA